MPPFSLSSIQRYGFSLYGQNKIGKKLIISIAFCGNKKKFVSLPYYIANSIIIHSYELKISNHIYLNYY